MVNLSVKVCLLGGQAVGKSCIAVRFARGTFDPLMPATIGGAYVQKDLETKNGTLYHLQIWDTAGQER